MTTALHTTTTTETPRPARREQTRHEFYQWLRDNPDLADLVADKDWTGMAQQASQRILIDMAAKCLQIEASAILYPRPARPRTATTAERVEAARTVAETIASGLIAKGMEFVIAGGKPLGDCKAKELRGESRFLNAVAGRIGRKRVRDALTTEQLVALYRQHNRSA